MGVKLGAVVVFKDGVTAEQAEKALKSIEALIEVPETSYEQVVATDGKGRSTMEYKKRPFKTRDMLNEFDPEMGSPVWYIP